MNKVIGFGNAIVDVICRVTDEFLTQHNLTKSNMKLVNENEFNNLLSNLTIEQTVAGGSVANSIVGLSQLGNQVSFIGKVNDDKLGEKYEESLTKEKVKFFYRKKKESVPTGTCLILITPDSERTMCTFLGIAGQVNQNDINEKAIKESEILLLEGYLWDEGNPKDAFNKAINIAHSSAMSRSDKFCVDRPKKEFLNLVQNKLDIIFANEQEIVELIGAKNFDEVINFGKKLNKLLIVTRSNKGSVAIHKSGIFECDSQKNLKIIDLTGAGDLFAAGFLHGHINKMSINSCLKKGTEMASRIIQKIGARLN